MINNETIKQIAHENSTAKTVFQALDKRQRYRKETNLTKLEHSLLNSGEKIVSDEYFDTFKKLESLGIGSLVLGRKGKPNRFIWNYSLKDVAKAAVKDLSPNEMSRIESKVVKNLKPGRPAKKRGPGRPPKIRVEGSLKASPFALTINNLSPNKIDRIMEFIKGL